MKVTRVKLPQPIKTVAVRIYPQLWDGIPFLDIALIGCNEPIVYKTAPPPSQVTRPPATLKPKLKNTNTEKKITSAIQTSTKVDTLLEAGDEREDKKKITKRIHQPKSAMTSTTGAKRAKSSSTSSIGANDKRTKSHRKGTKSQRHHKSKSARNSAAGTSIDARNNQNVKQQRKGTTLQRTHRSKSALKSPVGAKNIKASLLSSLEAKDERDATIQKKGTRSRRVHKAKSTAGTKTPYVSPKIAAIEATNGRDKKKPFLDFDFDEFDAQ